LEEKCKQGTVLFSNWGLYIVGHFKDTLAVIMSKVGPEGKKVQDDDGPLQSTSTRNTFA